MRADPGLWGPWARIVMMMVMVLIIFVMVTGVLAAMFPDAIQELAVSGTTGSLDGPLSCHAVLITGATELPVLFLIGWIWTHVDRKPLGELGLQCDRLWWREAGDGALYAVLAVAAVTVALWLLRRITIAGVDLSLFSRSPFDDTSFYAMGIAFLTQSSAEEILFRGYLLSNLRLKMPDALAVLLSSVLFSLLHGANPHTDPVALINIMLVGLVLGYITVRTASLALAIGFHFVWNFLLSAGVSLPVSGLPFDGVLVSRVIHATDTLSGGAFGPEGGLVATIVLLGCWYSLAGRPPRRPAGELPVRS